VLTKSDEGEAAGAAATGRLVMTREVISSVER